MKKNTPYHLSLSNGKALKYYLTPVTLAHITKTKPIHFSRSWEESHTQFTTGGNVDIVQQFWKKMRVFLKKLGSDLLHDPVIPCSGYHTEHQTLFKKDICIETLFTIDKT